MDEEIRRRLRKNLYVLCGLPRHHMPGQVCARGQVCDEPTELDTPKNLWEKKKVVK